MNNTKVVTLRMPTELKKRLEREASYQGVSINQLANYLLNIQISQLEMMSSLEARLKRKSITGLKKRVSNILRKVPSRAVPEWDRVE